MKAVVIYENREFVTSAVAILRRIGRRAEINVEWTVISWSVGAMSENYFSGKTFEQVKDAHLIILETKLTHSIPLRLLDWLERWAKLRHIPKAALGTIHEGDVGCIETPVCATLWEFVRKHGLTLISKESFHPENLLKPTFPFERGRLLALPVESYHSSNHDLREVYRSFGINE